MIDRTESCEKGWQEGDGDGPFDGLRVGKFDGHDDG